MFLDTNPAYIAIKTYWFAIKWVLRVALCAVLFIGGCNHGKKESKADLNAYRAKMHEQALKAQASAENAERAQKIAFDSIAKIHKKELQDAKQTANDITNGINNGVIRLRKHWGCDLPKAAGSAQEPDDSARLRATSAGRIIGIGSEADSQVKGLQAVAIACQKRVE